MKNDRLRGRIWIVVIAGAAILMLLAQPYVFAPHDRIPWRTDFAAAQKEAQAAHKPLFVDFSATWCGPCQYMKTSTWADRGVSKAMEAYIPVSIDVDAQHVLAAQFNAQTIPTFYILDPVTQDIQNGHTGVLEPDEFLDWLHGKKVANIGAGLDENPTFPPTSRRTSAAPATR
jgi:thiol:disulfide interchange protein